MESILTVHQISSAIVDIIEESKDYCFLVTPYFKPWELLTRALDKAKGKQKKIVFILRTDSANNDTISYLNREMGFDVVLIDRLHTKLYLNDSKALITSMNLYDSSKEFNYELGYIILGFNNIKKLKEKIIDDDLLSSTSKQVFAGSYFSEKKKSEEDKMKKIETVKQKSSNGKTYYMGYCIRCKKTMEVNRNYPLCDSCYEIWSVFMNPEYQEKYCHKCGNEFSVTKSKPFCNRCDKIVINNKW